MTRRILLSYLTITFVVLLVLEVPLGIFYAQREDERLAASLEGDASTIAMAYEDVLEQGAEPDPAAAELYSERTGARVVLTDREGTSLVDTDGDVPRDLSTRPEIEQALAGERARGTRSSSTLGIDLLYVAVPVGSGSAVLGSVRLTFDREEVAGRVRRFWAGLVLLGAAVMAAMAVVGWTIARWITGPLRSLSTTADRFASGDLRIEEVDATAPGEIRVLWSSLNHMAGRLDELVAEQRSFVADASHQLRTPLTALRLRLESLESESAAGPGAEEDLQAALAETARLATLVEDLLHLARAEEAGEIGPVDVGASVSQRLDTWSAQAEAEGVGLTTPPATDALWARAVPGGVEQILDNLLDNAIRCSPRDSEVLVTATRYGDDVVLTVADSGPGMEDDAKRRALERFWTGARSKGSGLGLPIALAVARASGGDLELLDSPGGGLTARVTLPAAEDSGGPI